jgi:hypothetical protein
VTLCDHALLELLGRPSRSDEDDGRGLGHQTVELQKCRVLVVILVDVDVELLDALDGELLVSQSQRVRIGCEALCVGDDVGWEGSGEEDGLKVLVK